MMMNDDPIASVDLSKTKRQSTLNAQVKAMQPRQASNLLTLPMFPRCGVVDVAPLPTNLDTVKDFVLQQVETTPFSQWKNYTSSLERFHPFVSRLCSSDSHFTYHFTASSILFNTSTLILSLFLSLSLFPSFFSTRSELRHPSLSHILIDEWLLVWHRTGGSSLPESPVRPFHSDGE